MIETQTLQNTATGATVTCPGGMPPSPNNRWDWLRQPRGPNGLTKWMEVQDKNTCTGFGFYLLMDSLKMSRAQSQDPDWYAAQ